MKEPKHINSQFQTAIIGAGFAGLGAGIRLKQMENHSFIILERASDIGGTWRDNTYPGCGCDVPSHLYSYSFEPNPSWSRAFSKQPEILDYIHTCTKKHGLREHIQFNTAIKKLIFDEIKGYWIVIDQNGKSITAKTVIAAIGPLNVPIFPKINGWENFGGVFFHSSHWPKGFDPSGKRIAIIGTGASAIQITPEIAPKAAQLFVFQRTAPWVMPKRDGPFSNFTKGVLKKIPLLHWLFRELIYWLMELRGKGLFGNQTVHRLATALAKKHIRDSIADPVLREKVTPDYNIGCKRVLPSNDYYPALQRHNVELITEPISSISEQFIFGKNGSQWEVDAIVYATGFEASEFTNRDITVIGRDGRNLLAEWKESSAEAYYGITVNGYPGLLFMTGPNTGLGHNSVIHMMESQLNYIHDYLKKLAILPPHSFFDVKKEIQASFNKKIQKALSRMVWASGCKSWYQTSTGKNTTLWPGHTFTYRKKTKKVNLEDYEVVENKVKEEAFV